MVENCLGTPLRELNKSLLHVTCFVDGKSKYQVGYSSLISTRFVSGPMFFHPPLNFLQFLLDLLSCYVILCNLFNVYLMSFEACC